MAKVPANVFTGARAVIYLNKNKIGLFTNCSWSIRQGKEPVFILGRYSPAEIISTTQEAVSITLTGYRVIGSGPYAKLGVAKLKDLLKDETDFSIEVFDRKDTKVPIFTAFGCRATGWSSGVASRGISDVRIDVVGLLGYDESSPDGDEDATAVKLTDGT